MARPLLPRWGFLPPWLSACQPPVADAHAQPLQLSLGFGGGGVVAALNGFVEDGEPVDRLVGVVVGGSGGGALPAHTRASRGAAKCRSGRPCRFNLLLTS